jgi:peptidoglycan/xylan/chitin deacetylase (PgdA/CDA1 family)
VAGPVYTIFTLAAGISLMKHVVRNLIFAIAALVVSGVASAQFDLSRRVAITFDDLPIAGSVAKDEPTRKNMTLGLLQSLARHEIPAIGFVNEVQLYDDDTLDEGRVNLLRLWVAAGLELGNHSYSHPDLHRVPLEEFQANVLRGERVTRQLLAEHGKAPEFFRHPFLHTGTDIEKKHAFEAFLTRHEYRVAPVSIDNSEWIFARAYDIAMQTDNTPLAAKVGGEYVEYMLKMFAFYEDQSQQIFARNIDHVLLVHANELNSAWFGVLADKLVDRGYEFISLSEALEDPAYDSPDTYTGPGGITWLHRWAITKKFDPAMFRGEPETPPYILKLTELREHNYPSNVVE